MENKVIVNVNVPEIDQDFDVYLPINKKIGNIVILLNKAINEMSDGVYPISSNNLLFNAETNNMYQSDVLLLNSDIRNGSKLVLISS